MNALDLDKAKQSAGVDFMCTLSSSPNRKNSYFKLLIVCFDLFSPKLFYFFILITFVSS